LCGEIVSAGETYINDPRRRPIRHRPIRRLRRHPRQRCRWGPQPTRRNTAKAEVRIWLAPDVVNKLRALRGPGESYSDVILRLATDGEPR
jgi:hypothetical protein